MSQQAIGLIETRGLVALVEGTDAMLKAANVELSGPVQQVGSALVSACVTGDVAAVKAATDAGAEAVKAIGGEIVSVHVIEALVYKCDPLTINGPADALSYRRS